MKIYPKNSLQWFVSLGLVLVALTACQKDGSVSEDNKEITAGLTATAAQASVTEGAALLSQTRVIAPSYYTLAQKANYYASALFNTLTAHGYGSYTLWIITDHPQDPNDPDKYDFINQLEQYNVLRGGYCYTEDLHLNLINLGSYDGDVALKAVLGHVFFHLKLMDEIVRAGSAGRLQQMNPDLAADYAYARYGWGVREQHRYMAAHREEGEELLRWAFPLESENFYKYGYWCGWMGYDELADYGSCPDEDLRNAVESYLTSLGSYLWEGPYYY